MLTNMQNEAHLPLLLDFKRLKAFGPQGSFPRSTEHGLPPIIDLPLVLAMNVPESSCVASTTKGA